MKGKAKPVLKVGAAFHKRLKAIAELKGMSVQEYCFLAIRKEMSNDEAKGVIERPTLGEWADQVQETQRQLYGDRVLSDSAEDIRRAREERTAQLEARS